jgi:hypothetical protein
VTALSCSCEQAEKAKIRAREAVVLLEQARMLLSEDNAVQLAMKHIDEAIREADRRAAMLEDWYRRTYAPADSGDRKGRINAKIIERVEAHYDTIEVPFGRIYHWHQGHAGHEDLIRGSQEDRSAPTGQEPRGEALPQERAELLRWLYSAQKEEQIDNTVAAADRWLVEAPHDEEVRRARDQAIQRRPGAPPL